MNVEDLIGALSPSEKLKAFEILWNELSPPEREFFPPAWHGEVLAERVANPDPAAPTDYRLAIAEIRAEIDERRIAE